MKRQPDTLRQQPVPGHLHILGICGTAMAAIAALAKAKGWRVTGSDAGVYPPMSDYLAGLGIEIAPYHIDNLDPAPDLVVIGNALSRANPEVEAVLDRGISYTSGAQFVGDHILPGRHAVVVAGTHGKTTTASLLAHVLEVAGKQPGFLIGGVPENFGGGARLGEGAPFVLEGDEYDTAFFDKRSKFLHYHARTLILNNLEYDHADIFPDLESIKRQFQHLLRTLPSKGKIVVNTDDPDLADVLSRGSWTPIVPFGEKGKSTVSSEPEWEWEAVAEDGTLFRLYHHGDCVVETVWGMIGTHHVANACAVAAAVATLGVDAATIARAFETFAGVRRRMSLVGEARGVRIYDDFAHHPTAIRGIVQAAKSTMKGSGRLWVIVEPRSNTMRTRIHQERLPGCFGSADRVIFVPASARNLKPNEVLDTEAVCRSIGDHAEVLPDVASIIGTVGRDARRGDHVLILSNGGFDGIHQKMLTALRAGEN